MKRKLCMSICLFSSILCVKGLTSTSVINTSSGPVRGFISTTVENVDYAAFKGIPYAKPPLNDLRFKPPVEADRWKDVYSATEDGSMCTQYSSITKSAVGSEDCLYINVFTPHTKFNSSILKPVMVWIYGGAFMSGYSNQSFYGPDFILGEDVIMVSFNYRLSALGFLNLQHENATGNYGMKDQNLALRWVKKNIASFGGDPDKITIFGQSAGSASVDLHVLSDMSAGLFSQSISMSGSPLCHWGFQTGAEALQIAFMLGAKLGIKTTSKDVLLKTLSKASAADIIVAANNLMSLPFKPSLEKINIAPNEEKFLTECLMDRYASGNYAKGPHMMGFTANETVSFSEIIGDLKSMETFDLIKSATKNRRKLLRRDLGENAMTSFWGSASDKITEDETYRLIAETTDIFFILGIDTKHQLISRSNNYPIYYYCFSFESNYSLHKTAGYKLDGVAHGDELPYILYMSVAKLPSNDSVIKMTRQRMVKLWTNFAKYGNPTPKDENDDILDITWPDSRSNGDHLNIGKNLTSGSRPVSNLVKVLQLFGLGSSAAMGECSNDKYSLLR